MRSIFLILIILAGYFTYKKRQVIISVFPTTYQFETSPQDFFSQDEISAAEASDVLILGDSLAIRFYKFKDDLGGLFKNKLRAPLNIYNWGSPHEGAHRTLYKLKSLKKIPNVVLYMGGSSEFYESFFKTTDFPIIYENINYYENPKIVSAMIIVPFLSRLIYNAPTYIKLGKTISPFSEHLPDDGQQVRMKIIYKYYEFHLQQMIDIIRQDKKNLILVTAPVNLDSPIRKNCKNTETDTLDDYIRLTKIKIKEGKAKEVYSELQETSKVAVGNANIQYILGQAAAQLGKFKEAQDALQLAHALDCSPWRANAVINSIIRFKARANATVLLDFDQNLNQHYGKNILFTDDINPQDIFWEKFIEDIGHEVAKILSL